VEDDELPADGGGSLAGGALLGHFPKQLSYGNLKNHFVGIAERIAPLFPLQKR